MKFQDSSFNGLKVTVGTKSVTHARTHARSKSHMPHQLFQSWGHNKARDTCSLNASSVGGKDRKSPLTEDQIQKHVESNQPTVFIYITTGSVYIWEQILVILAVIKSKTNVIVFKHMHKSLRYQG